MSIDSGYNPVSKRVEMQFNVYRGNARNEIYTDFDYDNSKDYFPVIIFTGATNFGVNSIRVCSDPHYNVLNTVLDDTDAINEGFTTRPDAGSNKGIKEIVFNDIDLAKLFGYKLTSYSSLAKVSSHEFKSENAFELADYADSFVIELLNIPILSYDGLTNQRRSILHTITQTSEIRERLTYTAPFPLFLEMSNANEMTVRRIRARILREDLSSVITSGLSQITLLIGD
jgi:hypothetical protein